MNSKLAKDFEAVIQYNFKDIKILKQALTHSSYSNEKKISKLMSNERLEFLGDAVLELVTSHDLYAKNPKLTEGELTKKRASIVCEPTLANCTKELDLGKYLLLGRGEAVSGGRERSSVLSDSLEAIIGAIYVDGGFEEAKKFILKFILKDIDSKDLFYDSKTVLQEMVQQVSQEPLKYVLTDEIGPDHSKEFIVEVHYNNKVLGKGQGKTKKAAEQEAAQEAIQALHTSGLTE